MQIKRLNTRTKIILMLQATGMLAGASTHIIWLLKHGFMAEEYYANSISMLFWDSLAFFDLLAVILLLFKPKAGLWLSLVIIVTDVLHNNVFYFNEMYLYFEGLGWWFQKYWMIACQIAFGIFVVLTFKNNLRNMNP